MSYKVTPPDLETSSSYDVYLKRLKVWEATTPAPKATHGPIIAGTLPNESVKYGKDLQDKFYEWVDSEALCKEGGLELVREFLKKELGEEDLNKTIRVWDELEDSVRGDMGIEQYISEFGRAYNKVKVSAKVELPDEILAFMLLKRSGADKTDRKLILSRLDKDDKSKMYESMADAIRWVMGDTPGAAAKPKKNDIKVEPLDDEEGVFVSQDGDRYVRDNNFYRGRGRGGGAWRGRGRGKPYDWPKDDLPRENRKDEKGEVTTCRTCGSRYHYQNACEVKKAKAAKGEDVNLVMGDEEWMEFALATQHGEKLSKFTQEAKNCAAVDTACTSNVGGKPWYEMLYETLSESDRKKVKGPLPSSKVFRFGNNQVLSLLGKYIVPVYIAGKKGSLEFDMIDSDIPLLLSKKSMKGLKMKLDIETDKCKIFGVEIDLETTGNGHYLLPLTANDDTGSVVECDWVLAIDLKNLDENEQRKNMKKLHA